MIHQTTLVTPWRTAPIRPLALTAVALASLAMLTAAALLWALGLGGPAGPTGVIQYRTEAGVFVARPDGQAADRAIVGLPAAAAPAERFPSPDGSVVALIEHTEGGAWLAIREGGDVRQIAQIATPEDPPLVAGTKVNVRDAEGVPLIVAWSPDSRYLAYGSVSGQPYTLNVVERGVWTPGRYEVRDGFVGELAWAPDASLLAMSSYSEDGRDHTVYLLEPEGRSLTKVIDGCAIVWSPDSRHLAFHRDPHREPGLWVLSADGGTASVVSSDPDAFPLAWLAE